MIKFKCPHCGKEVSAGDEHVGKKGRCPGCKELFVIPGAAAKPAPAAERRTPPPADEDAEDDAPPRKKRAADYDADDPDEVEELKRRTGTKVVKRKRDDEDEAVAEAPRSKRRERDEDDEDEPRPRKKRARYDEDEEDDEPRARRGRERYDEDEEEDRPRKKKKRKGKYATCPNCGCRGDATKVGFTWWGGLIGPALFSHVRCNRCGTSYNGKHGDYNTTRIAIYVGITFAIAIALCVAAVVANNG